MSRSGSAHSFTEFATTPDRPHQPEVFEFFATTRSYPPRDSTLLGRTLATQLIDNALAARQQPQVVTPAEQRICSLIREVCDLEGARIENPSLTCPSPDGVTLWVDRQEVLRELCFPKGVNHYQSAVLDSYRVWAPEGGSSVLHNPKEDKRSTQGVNHVVAFGYPVPADKIEVPRNVFAEMWKRALQPPDGQAEIPFTLKQQQGAATTQGIKGMTKILLHPTVSPEIPGVRDRRCGEVVVLAPGGSTIANLDFVARVFGLAGDPQDLENDLSWQAENWTGLTGCIVVAPHLVGLRKVDLGLPHWDQASERQRHEGMCWRSESELYNDGKAFKLTARAPDGRVVTIIADNYFGYNKKEIMTQLSFECNRVGGSQVEHAGGAEVARCVNLGRSYVPDPKLLADVPTLASVAQRFPETMEMTAAGYARDRRFPEEIIYLPKTAQFSRDTGKITWTPELSERGEQLCPAGELPLHFKVRYVAPNGFTVSLNREVIDGREYTELVGRSPELVFFHKPSTVSGGGKSELGKSIRALVRREGFSLVNPEQDLAFAEELCSPEAVDKYFRHHRLSGEEDLRGILDPRRTIGSVIKLLTPSSTEHTPEYNQWLGAKVPGHIRELICLIKQKLAPGLKVNDLFFSPVVDGDKSPLLRERTPGDSSIEVTRRLVRIGWDEHGTAQFFSSRYRNAPDDKYVIEDDISVTAVVPADLLRRAGIPVPDGVQSVKFVENCERYFFQRPDDAKVPGADSETERLFASDPNGFFVNYQALSKADVRRIADNVELFERFHPEMQAAMLAFLDSHEEYFACPAYPRIVEGKPTSNPRFLQLRPDLSNLLAYHHKDVALRLFRGMGEADREVAGADAKNPLPRWVSINVPAHRLAPPDPQIGLPPTAIWSMLHHLEGTAAIAKEICAVTPRSRSTNGVGDEGALTKGPFNFMLPVFDINADTLAKILTRTPTFLTAAGFIGPKFEVDHDITYLISSILSRMNAGELDPAFLLREGYLEKVAESLQGRFGKGTSALGSRITTRWVSNFGGRVYVRPETIMSTPKLRPESQDGQQFKEGLSALWRAYQAAAQRWVADGSYELAIPPVRRALDIMLAGEAGPGFGDPSEAELFSREKLLSEGSYYWRFLDERRAHELRELQRIEARQREIRARDQGNSQQIVLLARHAEQVQRRLQVVQDDRYLHEALLGTTGRDPGVRSSARMV